jgi:hypothetical protein
MLLFVCVSCQRLPVWLMRISPKIQSQKLNFPLMASLLSRFCHCGFHLSLKVNPTVAAVLTVVDVPGILLVCVSAVAAAPSSVTGLGFLISFGLM